VKRVQDGVTMLVPSHQTMTACASVHNPVRTGRSPQYVELLLKEDVLSLRRADFAGAMTAFTVLTLG
jgi:hypothetical protein